MLFKKKLQGNLKLEYISGEDRKDREWVRSWSWKS